MDRQVLISIAPEVLLAMKREETRRMEESLRADEDALLEKEKERSMLLRKLQGMHGKEAAKEKWVDDFMVFDRAIENGDLENAQNFDEKAMMNNILTMMNCDGGDNGGVAGVYGDDFPKIGLDPENATMETIVALVNRYYSCGGDNGGLAGDDGNDVPKIELDLEEKATVDAVADMVNIGGSCGGDNGGCAGDYDDIPKIGLDLEEKATMEKIVSMGNNDGTCGGDNGGFAGDYGDDVPKIKLGLKEKATVDTMVAMVNRDGSCGGDNGGYAGDYGSEEAIKAAIEGTNSDGGEGPNAGGYDRGGCDGNRRR